MQFGKWKDKKSRSKRALTVIAAAALILAVCSAIAAAAGEFGLLHTVPKRYPAGTFVSGVDISGLTRSAAKELLRDKAAELVAAYSCTIRYDGGEKVIKAEDVSLSADTDDVLRSAYSGGSYDIGLGFSEYHVRRKVRELAAELDIEPRTPVPQPVLDAAEAKERGRFVLAEGTRGRSLDIEACVSAILSGCSELEAPFIPLPLPEGQSLEELIPKLLGEYSTSFASGSLAAQNRVFNINKAAGLINGIKLAPGAVFSCNEALGKRTAQLGWKDAPGITDGGADTQDQPGGGVCQVSTTLFNAALLADLEIVSRQGHSRRVSYAEPGRDATIDTDSIDFKFKNSTGNDIWIFAWTDESSREAYCQIYGYERSARNIDIVTVLVDTIPPGDDEYVEDPSLGRYDKVLDNEAITGYDYETYRVYYENGEEVERELVAETHYNMHPRRFRVGTGYFAASAPAVTSSPTAHITAAPTPYATAAPTSEPTPYATPEPTPYETPEPTLHYQTEPPEPTEPPEKTPEPT